MEPIFSTLIYKLACLASGMLFAFLGYRLFVLGIFDSAGDMDARFKNNRLILKKAAPGTFFALFGACVIVLVIWTQLKQDVKITIAPSNIGKQDTTSVDSGKAPIGPVKPDQKVRNKKTYYDFAEMNREHIERQQQAHALNNKIIEAL